MKNISPHHINVRASKKKYCAVMPDGQLMRTPGDRGICSDSKQLIEAIVDDLDQFQSLMIEDDAISSRDSQLGYITLYSLYSSYMDFPEISEDLVWIKNTLKDDPVLHPISGPEVVQQMNAWSFLFGWIRREFGITSEESNLFVGGITSTSDGVEFYSILSELEIDKGVKTGKHESDLASGFNFNSFAEKIYHIYKNIPLDQVICIRNLIQAFDSLLLAMCFIYGKCSSDEYVSGLMACVPEYLIDRGPASNIPTMDFSGNIVDISNVPDRRSMFREISDVAQTCNRFMIYFDSGVSDLIAKGESKTIEFKSTLSIDLKDGKKQKFIEDASMKNIVAFINSDGGTLLIGVSDDGVILGIDKDKKLYQNSTDKFLLKLKNMIKERIGEDYYPFINSSVISVLGKEIAKVDCEPSKKPCFLDGRDYYVRTNPGTDKLEGQTLMNYITNRNHFNNCI